MKFNYDSDDSVIVLVEDMQEFCARRIGASLCSWAPFTTRAHAHKLDSCMQVQKVVADELESGVRRYSARELRLLIRAAAAEEIIRLLTL